MKILPEHGGQQPGAAEMESHPQLTVHSVFPLAHWEMTQLEQNNMQQGWDGKGSEQTLQRITVLKHLQLDAILVVGQLTGV